MIKAQNLTLRRGTKLLLDNADFVIYPQERIGIVGRNGAGKTSLFSVLHGQLDIDAGNLDMPADWRISSVEQIIHDTERNIRDFVIDGDKHLRDLQKQRLNANESDGMLIAELETALVDAQEYSANSRAEQLLSGLGFASNQFQTAVGQFSGGWQMRAALAKALMAPSDLLLLDEPTNHLDLDAMLWLERWLNTYPGTIIIISHDTEFLDNVVKHVLHFEHKKINKYKGNYQSFLMQRAQTMQQNQQAWEKQQREAARLQGFIDRFKAKASKARQAQSRIKALDRMQALAPIHAESNININIPQPENLPDPLLILENAVVGYIDDNNSQRPILNNINITVRGGDRIGVLGVNGAGKSTLIKTIAQEIELLSGSFKPAKGMQIGYFAQHQLDMLDDESSALQHLIRIAPDTKEQDLRNYLGGFGFGGTMVTEKIAPMSGGEKARLALAIIVWSKPNILLLDEPSNHLDVETRQALTSALSEFNGSMILISHDRNLLRTSVDNFWIVHNGRVDEYDGDLDDYKTWVENNKQAQNNNIDSTESVISNTSNDSNTNRREQRRIQAQERQRIAKLRQPIENKISKLEKELKKHQHQLEELNVIMSLDDFYTDAMREQRSEIIEKHGIVSKNIDDLEEQWLVLNEELETI